MSGGTIIQRDTLNLIPGPGVIITEADNPVTRRADVTVSATATGSGTPFGVASGTNTYTVTLGLASYTLGKSVIVQFTNANTGAATLNCDGLGAKAIQLYGAALTTGQIPAGSSLELVYDGAQWQIVGEVGGGGVTYTDTGILVVGGAIGGIAIPASIVGSEVRGLCTGSYNYQTPSKNWQLWVYPAPPNTTTFTLDVRKIGFTANSTAQPNAGNSIVAGAGPTIAGSVSGYVTATGSQSTWTGAPIGVGDMLTVVPTLNTAQVQHFVLFMPARRTF